MFTIAKARTRLKQKLLKKDLLQQRICREANRFDATFCY